MSAGCITCRGSTWRHLVIIVFGATLLPVVAGCSNYRWMNDFQAAEDYARQQHKHLFIFYKWWLSNDSNRMHGDVLSDPAVGMRLNDTVNLLLEKDSCPDYARYLSKYGVTMAPAFVIVAPDGSYQVRTGFVPKDRFIEFIESAKAARPVRPGARSTPPPARPAPAPRKPILAP